MTSFVYIRETDIRIVVPAVPAPIDVNVIIIFDGLTYNNETVFYSYKIYSALSLIDPNFGPTSGGTLIKVAGDRFDSQAFCRIDGTIIKPIIINNTLMLCESPRHKAATGLVFELEFNGGVHSTGTGLTYSYYNDVQINYL